MREKNVIQRKKSYGCVLKVEVCVPYEDRRILLKQSKHNWDRVSTAEGSHFGDREQLRTQYVCIYLYIYISIYLCSIYLSTNLSIPFFFYNLLTLLVQIS